MAKAKTTHALVLLKSMVSTHKFVSIRPKQGEKLEMLKFDPYVQKEVLYREMKKIKSVKGKDN